MLRVLNHAPCSSLHAPAFPRWQADLPRPVDVFLRPQSPDPEHFAAPQFRLVPQLLSPTPLLLDLYAQTILRIAFQLFPNGGANRLTLLSLLGCDACVPRPRGAPHQTLTAWSSLSSARPQRSCANLRFHLALLPNRQGISGRFPLRCVDEWQHLPLPHAAPPQALGFQYDPAPYRGPLLHGSRNGRPHQLRDPHLCAHHAPRVPCAIALPINRSGFHAPFGQRPCARWHALTIALALPNGSIVVIATQQRMGHLRPRRGTHPNAKRPLRY